MSSIVEAMAGDKIHHLQRDGREIFIDRESGYWVTGSTSHQRETHARFLRSPERLRSFPRVQDYNIPLECTFYLTNSCNLDCVYCYSTPERSRQVAADTFSVDNLRKVVPAVLSMNWPAVNFFLYGGEPLLVTDLMTELVRMVHHVNKQFGKQVSFVTQSNGTQITNRNVKLLQALGISIGISMDGPPHIHNRNRPRKGGGPSHDRVAAGLHLLCEHQIPFTITATIRDPADTLPVFEYFLERQWTSSIRLSPMLPEGLASKGYDSDYMVSFARQFAAAHIEIAHRLVAHNRNSSFKIRCGNLASMVNNLISDSRPDFCLRSPCGAGYGMIEFHPDGVITTCDKAFYDKGLGVVGHLDDCVDPSDLDGLYRNSALRKRIAGRHSELIPECDVCAFKRHCGGGCTLGSYTMFGSFQREDVLCRYRKYMFEELLWLLAENPYNALLLTHPGMLP